MSNKGNVVAIIPARGGSKGIKNKNIIPICGHPLVAWTINHAKSCSGIDSVWVTSDDDKILEISEKFGAQCIKRPEEISTDSSSSEAAWLHAIDYIENLGIDIEKVVALQPTSPVRESYDLENAILQFDKEKHDSMFAATAVEDYFIWKVNKDGFAESVNYDYKNRKRRQEIDESYVENGSFYIFKPEIIRRYNNRLGGKIGIYKMARHKMYQIDNQEDIKLCEAIISGYNYEIEIQ